jgi:hypothetical protein
MLATCTSASERGQHPCCRRRRSVGDLVQPGAIFAFVRRITGNFCSFGSRLWSLLTVSKDLGVAFGLAVDTTTTSACANAHPTLPRGPRLDIECPKLTGASRRARVREATRGKSPVIRHLNHLPWESVALQLGDLLPRQHPLLDSEIRIAAGQLATSLRSVRPTTRFPARTRMHVGSRPLHAPATPVTFLERVATLPARLRVLPKLEILTFEDNPRDPDVMALLAEHSESINARALKTRSGRTLRVQVDPAPPPTRPPTGRAKTMDRFHPK